MPQHMAIADRIARWGSARLSRRLGRSLPWIGTAVALVTIAATVRRKGLIGGTFDTGLNAIPMVGAVKNVVELARGRDFFPERRRVEPGVR
jgi:DNA-binding IclR family transcriptional regulator